MDLEQLVRQAARGEVDAFVALTRRFQHFTFGSALALIQDFQQAEDVVQEAFAAAWSALPSLADPAAFPGWLRGIVRHHAFRVLRRRFVCRAERGAQDLPRNTGRAARRSARGSILFCRQYRGDPLFATCSKSALAGGQRLAERLALE